MWTRQSITNISDYAKQSSTYLSNLWRELKLSRITSFYSVSSSRMVNGWLHLGNAAESAEHEVVAANPVKTSVTTNRHGIIFQRTFNFPCYFHDWHSAFVTLSDFGPLCLPEARCSIFRPCTITQFNSTVSTFSDWWVSTHFSSTE